MTELTKKRLYESVMDEMSRVVKNLIDEHFLTEQEDSVNEDSSVLLIKENDDIKELFKKQFRKFIESTTEDEREEIYNSSLRVYTVMHNSPLMEEETLKSDDVVNAYDAVAFLKRKYNLLHDEQIKVIKRANGKVSFIAIAPGTATDMERLEADAKRLGYYKATKGFERFDKKLWAIYNFEPVSQPNVRSEISKTNEYLVHVTPIVNLKNIKRNGIIKKKSEDINNFIHPERIYLVASKSKMRTIAQATAQMLYEKRKQMGQEYALIYIRFENLPDYITVHYDGNYTNDENGLFTGVFVEDDIPATCIESIELFDCVSEKQIKDSFWNKLRDAIIRTFNPKYCRV